MERLGAGHKSTAARWNPVVCLVLVTFSVVTLLGIRMAKHVVVHDAINRALAQQRIAASLLAGPVDSLPVSITLRHGSDHSALVDAAKRPGAAKSVLAGLLASDSRLVCVFVASRTGAVTAMVTRGNGPLHPSLAINPWPAGASRSQFGAYPTAGQVLEVASRIGPPTDVSYLVGLYSLQALRAAVAGAQSTIGRQVVLVNAAGAPLQSSPIQAGGPGSASTPVTRNRPPRAAWIGHGHARTLAATAAVGHAGWSVTVYLPAAQAMATYYGIRNALALPTVVALGLALLLFTLTITPRRRRRLAEQESLRAYAASEQRFEAAFVHAPIGIVRLSTDNRLLEVNRAFCEMLARRSKDLVGTDVAKISHPEDDAASEQMMLRLSEPGERSATVEKRFLAASGTAIWCMVSAVKLLDAAGQPYVMAQVVDISERKLAEVELSERAMHDALTGLPNRLLLESRIEHALSRLSRDVLTNLAVLFIDLDGFKEVNDRLGHQLGDEVLREIAERLQNAVRPGDTVARLGGDEFVILCEALPGDGVDGALYVSNRVLRMVNERGGSADKSWQVSASIGISRPLGFPDTAAALIDRADAAMYRSKQQGKNRVETYDPSMAHSNSAAQRSVTLIESALAEDRLRLHYQPLYDLRTRTIVGAESLVRMIDHDGGLLPPAAFLAAAEAHGQIVDFGAWSLMQACLNAVTWKAGLPLGQDFTIAVNMSVKEIEDSGFLRRVDEALQASGLAPESLAIELTESAFLRDIPTGRVALEGLRERGVKLSLDDFGTGFSSLSYLRRFPVDTIKLDRSFVTDLRADAGGARVTRGLIALARTLETVLVAEGVEDEHQVGALLSLGSNLAQGYLLSRPLDSESFSALLHRPVRHEPASKVLLPEQSSRVSLPGS